jgi:hypothetical protein
MHGRDEQWYKILVDKLKGKRQLERSRLRWEDNIETDLREIGFGNVDFSASGQIFVVDLNDTLMNVRF